MSRGQKRFPGVEYKQKVIRTIVVRDVPADSLNDLLLRAFTARYVDFRIFVSKAFT